jgi:hypothetical protein
VDYELVGEVTEIETIAEGLGIRARAALTREFGPGHWRKRKGFATVRLPNGTIRRAEIHWFEAHGIGRRKLKVKRVIR